MHLAVTLPRLPATRGQARTQARIGRKVGALFGIAGDRADGDAGAGRAWLSSYAELTMNELLLGGPQRLKKVPPWVQDTGVFEPSVHGRRTRPVPDAADARRGYGEIDDAAISPALIRGYGPDPKAAVTLVGVNSVLAPLTEALKAVLTELDFPDERLLVGTTAMLLSEAFRSQPLLILAGVQASRIQRAYRLEDRAVVAADAPSATAPWRSGRTDLALRRLNEQSTDAPSSVDLSSSVTLMIGDARGPRAAPAEDSLQPYRLRLVDEVWEALTSETPNAPRSATGPARLVPIAGQASRARQRWDSSHVIFTRERALAVLTGWVEGIVFGLGDGVGGTRIVLRRMPDGRFTADFPGFATRPARVLADNVLGNYFAEPDELTVIADDSPSPVPTFDPDRWRHEPELVQRVALWAHHCAERFVSSGAWSEQQSHNANLRHRVAQRERLADTAADWLGQDDALSVQLRLFATRFRMEQYRKQVAARPGADGSKLAETVLAFEVAITALYKLYQRGRLTDSHLVESLQATLAELVHAKSYVDSELAARIRGLLEHYWEVYLTVQLGQAGGTETTQWPGILYKLGGEGAWEDPVYATILESSPNLGPAVAEFDIPDALAVALDVQENTRLRRKALFRSENVWPLYRDTLVDKAKLLLRRRDECAGARRTAIGRELIELTEELFGEELGDEWRAAPASLQRGLALLPATDALLLQVVEYLRVSGGQELDRLGIGLRVEVLQVLRGYADGILERLTHGPWQDELSGYRAVLEAALHPAGRDATP